MTINFNKKSSHISASACFFVCLFVCFFFDTGHSPISTIGTLWLWCSFWRPRNTRYSREPRTRGIHGHRGTTRSTRFNGTTRGQRRRRKAGKPRPLRSTGTSRENGTSRVHEELKVTQEIKEAREPQALRDLRDLQELWGEIGNSVFSKLWAKERTLAW